MGWFISETSMERDDDWRWISEYAYRIIISILLNFSNDISLSDLSPSVEPSNWQFSTNLWALSQIPQCIMIHIVLILLRYIWIAAVNEFNKTESQYLIMSVRFSHRNTIATLICFLDIVQYMLLKLTKYAYWIFLKSLDSRFLSSCSPEEVRTYSFVDIASTEASLHNLLTRTDSTSLKP